jgi:PhnB protein
MNFYQSVFGGNFISFQRYKDVPGGEKMSPEAQEQIVHASLPVGKTSMIMATDTVDTMEQNLVAGNNIYLCIHAETETEADKLFDGLSKGGKIEMPMNKTFWGAYFGMCMDKFGIHWMMSYEAQTGKDDDSKKY